MAVAALRHHSMVWRLRFDGSGHVSTSRRQGRPPGATSSLLNAGFFRYSTPHAICLFVRIQRACRMNIDQLAKGDQWLLNANCVRLARRSSSQSKDWPMMNTLHQEIKASSRFERQLPSAASSAPLCGVLVNSTAVRGKAWGRTHGSHFLSE